MTQQEIYELIARFEQSTLQTMKLFKAGFSLELAKGTPAYAPSEPQERVLPAVKSYEPQLPAVTAPLVGIFYTSPEPDQPPFVSVGDRVKKGSTVCLIEAMKMISEVPAPCDCVIEAIVKENGQLAAFGEALLRYRPC